MRHFLFLSVLFFCFFSQYLCRISRCDTDSDCFSYKVCRKGYCEFRDDLLKCRYTRDCPGPSLCFRNHCIPRFYNKDTNSRLGVTH
ncbi:unnamed protein product [Caenorhabditis bovis]|uniref:EB domain-containing protein n=1 Tax=Caenorhabditis bovis TaxID=2654633 RepID=A0A8S1EJM9_9PELO|nr:unnamed protein product [Caenorhabditis bovis]